MAAKSAAAAGAPAASGTGFAAGVWDAQPFRHTPAVDTFSSDMPSSSSGPPSYSSKAPLLAAMASEQSYQGHAGASYSGHSAPPTFPSPPASSTNAYVQLLDDPDDDEIVPVRDAGQAPGGTEARAISAPAPDQTTGGGGDGQGSAIGDVFRRAAQAARDAGGAACKLSDQLSDQPGLKFAAGCLGLAGRGLEALGGKGAGDVLNKLGGDGAGDAVDDAFGIQDEDDAPPMSPEEVRRKFRKEAIRRLLAVEHLRFGREGPLTKGFDMPGSAHAKLAALHPEFKDPHAAADAQLSRTLDRINRTSDQLMHRACQRLETGMIRSRYLGEPATVRRDTAASDILDRASQRLEAMMASKRLAYPVSRLRKPPPPTPPPPPLSFWERSYAGLHEKLTSFFPLAAKCLPEARAVTAPVAAVEPKFLIDGGATATTAGEADGARQPDANFMAKFGDGVEALGKKLQGVGMAKGGAALEKAGASIERLSIERIGCRQPGGGASARLVMV